MTPFPPRTTPSGRNDFSHYAGDRDTALMIGLDFGSTTSRALVARARMERSMTTGRMEFGSPDLLYRSEPVFTPFDGEELSRTQIIECIDSWLEESGIDCQKIFSGGVIITGLAAEQANAHVIAQAVRERIGHVIVATADDPCLESWLAFMGNSLELSRQEPLRPVINLDIGGGTTNPAQGLDGNVLAAGSYFLGARHFRFQPGSYHLLGLSRYGRMIFERLGIETSIGETMSEADVTAVVDFIIRGLEAIVAGEAAWFSGDGAGAGLCQAPYNDDVSPLTDDTIITFSGGVGELLYRLVMGEELPGTTWYGDLGIDICRGIVDSPLLSRSLYSHVPEFGGRATVYGLTLHSAELSGNTLYMPCPGQLPLHDLPIVARLTLDADESALSSAVELACRSPNGACIQAMVPAGEYPRFPQVKQFGERLAGLLEKTQFPENHPLLLLAPQDFGKVIGNYATRWGQLPVNLMAVDEVPDRPAEFVSLGAVRNYVIPVYFYGMH